VKKLLAAALLAAGLLPSAPAYADCHEEHGPLCCPINPQCWTEDLCEIFARFAPDELECGRDHGRRHG
jgi:hypothetical protein